MDRLRQLAPWQIIAGAVTLLVLVIIGGYFLITALTTTPPPPSAVTTVPQDLGSAGNEAVLKQLDVFETPKDLPLVPEPVQTVDPNAPSTVNPFR